MVKISRAGHRLILALILLTLIPVSTALAQPAKQAACVQLADYKAAFDEIRAIGLETGTAIKDYQDGKLTRQQLLDTLAKLRDRAFELMWALAESVPCDKQAAAMAKLLFDEAQTAYNILNDTLIQNGRK